MKAHGRGQRRVVPGRAASPRPASPPGAAPRSAQPDVAAVIELQRVAGNGAVAELLGHPPVVARQSSSAPANAAATSSTTPADSGPSADSVEVFPIFDRGARKKVFVPRELYERERATLGRYLRALATAIPNDAKEVLASYPFEEVRDMYADVMDSLATAGRHYARGNLLMAGAFARDASRYVDIEEKAVAILRREGAFSYVGKRVSFAVVGIFQGAAETVLGLVDQGAALVGVDAGAVAWNTRQYAKIKDAWSGVVGIDHNLTHDDELGRMGGKVATGLAMAKVPGKLGTAGTMFTVVTAAAGANAAITTVRQYRKAGKSWAEIARDPVVLSQVAGALGGIAGAGSASLPQVKQFFDQMGLAMSAAQMSALTTALAYETDANKRLDLLADLLTTAGSAADTAFAKPAPSGAATDVAPPGAATDRAPPATPTSPTPKPGSAGSPAGTARPAGRSGGGSRRPTGRSRTERRSRPAGRSGRESVHDRFDVSDVEPMPTARGGRPGTAEPAAAAVSAEATTRPDPAALHGARKRAVAELRKAREAVRRYQDEPPDSPIRVAAEHRLLAAQDSFYRAFGRMLGLPPPLPDRIAPRLWDAEMVIQLKGKTSYKQHRDLFGKLFAEDATREIGLFRNSETGEYIVIRGNRGDVSVGRNPKTGRKEGPAGGGKAQRWKEILDAGSDVGHWEMVAHSHPSRPYVRPANRYPSGARGDFAVIVGSSRRSGWTAKQSRIYYRTPKGTRFTDFGFDPHAEQPYWVRPHGQPERRFRSMEAYHEFIERTFNVDPGRVRKGFPVGPVRRKEAASG